MNAKITVDIDTQDVSALLVGLGEPENSYNPDTGELTIFGVSQSAADTALANAPTPGIRAEDINAECKKRIEAGFIFSGKIFQSAEKDQINIIGVHALAMSVIQNGGGNVGDYRWHGGSEDFSWIAADNTEVVMDAQTVVAFGAAAAEHKRAHIYAARSLKNMSPIPTDYATNETYWP